LRFKVNVRDLGKVDTMRRRGSLGSSNSTTWSSVGFLHQRPGRIRGVCVIRDGHASKGEYVHVVTLHEFVFGALHWFELRNIKRLID